MRVRIRVRVRVRARVGVRVRVWDLVWRHAPGSPEMEPHATPASEHSTKARAIAAVTDYYSQKKNTS